MPDIRVFCDFVIDEQVPLYVQVAFAPGELDWNEAYLRLPLSSPFQLGEWDELGHDERGISIELEDLTAVPDCAQEIGIYLPSLQKKWFQDQVGDIRHFLIRLQDIEEVLQAEVMAFRGRNGQEREVS